jgi:hypothetical protein
MCLALNGFLDRKYFNGQQRRVKTNGSKGRLHLTCQMKRGYPRELPHFNIDRVNSNVSDSKTRLAVKSMAADIGTT